MPGTKLLMDVVHKGGVLTLMAGTVYGSCICTSGLMEIRAAGLAAKNKAQENQANPQ